MKLIPIMNKQLETEEPMHCWRQSCKEELNGLMHYSLNYSSGFIFSMWLCYNCSKKFDKIMDLKLTEKGE